MILVVVFAMFMIAVVISVIIVSCVIVQRRRKTLLITLNEGIWSYQYQYIYFTSLDSLLTERALVHYPQATNNKYVITIYYYHYSITLC